MRATRTWVVVLATALLVTPLAVWASDRFEDVPDDNVFHDDIGWMADSGVTFGCNPPENTRFCPSENVTREQMSAFMRRLSEGQIVDAATAVEAEHAATADSATTADSAATAGEAEHAATADSADSANTANTANRANRATNADNADNADRVDGFHARRLAPRAAFNASNNLPNQDTSLETTLTAPAPGVLILTGTVDAVNISASSDPYGCQLLIDGGVVPGTTMIASVGGGANREENCATSGGAAVEAGTHTIEFNIVGGGGDTSLFEGSVTAMWVPFDGSGAVPATATELGDPAEIQTEREPRLEPAPTG